MQRTITQVEQIVPFLPALKRVAAYARISSGKDSMLHSLSAQISYYNGLIQRNPEWLFAGVYSDEGITGTKDARPGFQRMLDDCRSGKIDMVITKSISRFARNTLTLLETVRELKGLGVDVFFEEQNIHSISGDGELMLTILASFAQEESLSVSENCKWRIREEFKKGIVGSITMLGYRRTDDGELEVIPEEAEIVRMIFSDYLSGMGRQAIVSKLNNMDILTRRGTIWHPESISVILKNEKYTGDMLLQKTYQSDHLTKRKCINNGSLPMYLVQDSHEPIICKQEFDAVQAEMKRRAGIFVGDSPQKAYPFTGKIACGCCGNTYRRKMASAGTKYKRPVWICTTFNTYGKKNCLESRQIPEDILLKLSAQVLGLTEFDPVMFDKKVERMTAVSPNLIVYNFKDGREITAEWQNRPRSSLKKEGQN